MQRHTRQLTITWLIVGTILAGILVTAAGVCLVQASLIIAGIAVASAGGVAAVVLPRLHLGIPISFAEDFPKHSSAAAESAPADRRDPEEITGPEPDRYRMLPEVPSSQLPDTPDAEGAVPQHVNLGPHERVRRIGGREVIEMPEDPDD